ncbi:nucleoside hydrolase [Oceanivirga salmonicida]|uniref:nucleoside hydrolase n=1 Tax=Oceanivirga salmonicida TaxID=1769291 RepID=UPI00082DBF9C|nr:nucleoside hydrolase [Oceanivirga salmonicida]
MKKKQIIIDCDPGIDDFLALMLAKSSKNLNIIGITTVAGNQTLDITSKNAKNIAKYINIDTKIAKGANKPLIGELKVADEVHGENGIANIILEESNQEFEKDYAWDLIYKEARTLGKELEIVALGPLTNIAIAILKYPDIVNYIKKIVIMGGSTTVGNVTPYAEFNIWIDPVAADIVFKSGIPLFMVGLNVTMKSRLNEFEIKEISNLSGKFSGTISTLLNKVLDFYKSRGYDSIAVHDALTIAYLIDETILKFKKYYTAIETLGRLNYGRTVVDLDNSHRDKVKNVDVAIEVDFDKFKEMLKDMAKYYE